MLIDKNIISGKDKALDENLSDSSTVLNYWITVQWEISIITRSEVCKEAVYHRLLPVKSL